MPQNPSNAPYAATTREQASPSELLRGIGKAFLESQEQNEEVKDLIKLLLQQVAILTLIVQQETDSPHLDELLSTQTLLERYKLFLDNRSLSRKEFIKNLAFIAQKIHSP